MPHPEPEDSRVVSVRLPTTLIQRLDRLLDWHTTHRRRPTTHNAALREALGAWLDQHEQLAGLLDPESLRQQCRAAYDSLRPSPDGGPHPSPPPPAAVASGAVRYRPGGTAGRAGH